MRTITDPAPILARQQGRSDTAFARLLGVDRQTLYRWRRGQVAKINCAERIAERLGVHVDELWPEEPGFDPEWRSKALCAGKPTDLFFVERGESMAEAKALCLVCPVRSSCLEWVLTNVRANDDHGVWAGTSARERRAMRRTRRPEAMAS